MDRFCNEANYRFFNALSNRTRLAIIDLLRDKPRTADEIAQALKVEPEAIWHYLELLAGCMILQFEGVGKEKRYSLNKEILEPLGELLSSHTSKYCPALRKAIPEEKIRAYQKKVEIKEEL
ncbi:MAG TPA: winged helix-turn-helix domain-containing protein [Candidatus Acidoferrales bacterium]|nr:winged helix-turn-helix domain-containing protein [Candidatus Acidoferrales bacterium]